MAGAGTMGSGIAIVAARAGFQTVLFDVDETVVQRASDQIGSFLTRSVERGRLTAEQREAALRGLTASSDVEQLSDCSFVIEAVFEDPLVKGEVLARINKLCSPEAIFASNTSTLSITALGAASGRPERFVGMHFCLPAQIMKLVEMTPGLVTDPTTFETAWQVCVALGQQPVRTQDRPGFILNHFIVPFNNDAIRLVESGAAEPAEVDRAVKGGLGYPMGPCELLDYVGLDTQERLCDALFPVTNDPRAACPPLVRRMVAAGHLGRKTGRGFYSYDGPAMFGA
ncbi:MAG TPA: 3-hydroxyacyl-CoA dehydrogenase family protein [Chloroflexota bacterium]|nr:3-hydroxyacyl-CoA dehydrogenase family protein [Chloroflexota bacterium]